MTEVWLNSFIISLYIYISIQDWSDQRSHDFDNGDVSFDNPKISPCEVNNSIITLNNLNFFPLGGDNRKSSVCVENMATAGRFAASSEEEIESLVIYGYHFLSVDNFSVCCHIGITFCLLSILDCCHKGIIYCPLLG